MSVIIGIDLGTTNSAAAVVVKDRPRLIPVDGERLLPSCVGLSPDNRIIVGHEARNQVLVDPDRTILSIKRRMGTSDTVRLGSRTYTPQEISSFILRKLKVAAEDYLKTPVDKAVITVPANFGDAQRRATQEAGELAGLEVVRILNEPTAAALAFGVDSQTAQHVAVYDLGGGTFDVSIIEMQDGVLEVLSSVGNERLGGDDFDQILAQSLIEEVEREESVILRDQRVSVARLRRAAEEAKMRLSTEMYTTVREEFLPTSSGTVAHLEREISRHQFEEMVVELIAKTQESLEKALRGASITPERIRKTLLVGGSTRIPLVAQLVQSIMGKAPSREVHPDEAVALGAGIQAAIIEGKEVHAVLVDVVPHSLGIEVVHREMGVLLPDVMSFLIRKNAPVPCSMTEEYSTISDDQKWAEINVYQGEHPVASENQLLSTLQLKGLRGGRAGEPVILVTFDYDINGMVQIKAVDKTTGSQEQCTVKVSAPKLTESQRKRAQTEMPQIVAVSQPMDSARSVLGRAQRMVQTKQGPVAEKLRSAIQALEKAIAEQDSEFARTIEDEVVDLMYELEW